MIVGIELRQIRPGSSGGIVVHLKGLLCAWFATAPDIRFVLFAGPFNQDLFDDVPANVRKMTLSEDDFFGQVDAICSEMKVDVLFRSYPMLDDLEFPLRKQIFFMPDLQHESFPDFFTAEELRYRRMSFNRGLALAGGIATNTQYTRGTIVRHRWTRCENIAVVSPACPANSGTGLALLTAAASKQIPSGEFFLYPANLWQHKNHRRVLTAFAALLNNYGRPIELVFTGHPEGWNALYKDFSHLPIRHLGFVSDELLRQLYRKAHALVFFSLYEGFGMPLLEAFSAETPVICSNTSSLPEVGGDAVLACDPTDTAAMALAMRRILEDADLVKHMVQKGKGRLGLFTWEQSARNLLDACERVVQMERDRTADAPATLPAWRPVVTVVTPSYNQGRFLKRTIDSVLTQAYPNIDYIVVDGNSTDDSVDILRSYGDKVRWVSEPDNGQTDAINKGFAMSGGEIMCYLNSDDALIPGAIEKVVRYFSDHPECDMVYGEASYIDVYDAETGRYNTAEYSFERLMFDCCVCQPAAFWRRRIARKVGEFNQKLNFAMDYDYWLRIDRAGGNIQHMPELLASSRLYAETKTLSSRRDIYRETFEACLKHGGYVDRNYFFGLWHHLTHENENSWLGRSKMLKKNYVSIASLHYYLFHLYHNPGRITVPPFLQSIVNRLPRRLLPNLILPGK